MVLVDNGIDFEDEYIF